MKIRSIITAILAAMMMIAPSKMSAQEEDGGSTNRLVLRSSVWKKPLRTTASNKYNFQKY